MKKRLLAVFGVAAAMCLCFALAGCGGSSAPAAANHLQNPLRFIIFLLSFPFSPPALPAVFPLSGIVAITL